MQRLKNFINARFLEQRYGGYYENLTTYWPPPEFNYVRKSFITKSQRMKNGKQQSTILRRTVMDRGGEDRPPNRAEQQIIS